MNAETQSVVMRKRIHQRVDQMSSRSTHFAVFSAHRINLPRIIAEHRGNFVGVESGSVDDAARFDRFFLFRFFVADFKVDANRVLRRRQRNDFRPRHDVCAVVGRKPRVRPH